MRVASIFVLFTVLVEKFNTSNASNIFNEKKKITEFENETSSIGSDGQVEVIEDSKSIGSNAFISLYVIGGSKNSRAKIIACTSTSITIAGSSQYLSQITGGTIIIVTPNIGDQICTGSCLPSYRQVLRVETPQSCSIWPCVRFLTNDALLKNILSMKIINDMGLSSSAERAIVPKFGCTEEVQDGCNNWISKSETGQCRYTDCFIGTFWGDTRGCYACRDNCHASCATSTVVNYLKTKNNVINFNDSCCSQRYCYSSKFKKEDCDLSLLRNSLADCSAEGCSCTEYIASAPITDLSTQPCYVVASVYYAASYLTNTAMYSNKQNEKTKQQKSSECIMDFIIKGNSPGTIGTCGGGKEGNKLCPNPEQCCSQFGQCGSGSQYCISGPTDPGISESSNELSHTTPLLQSGSRIVDCTATNIQIEGSSPLLQYIKVGTTLLSTPDSGENICPTTASKFCWPTYRKVTSIKKCQSSSYPYCWVLDTKPALVKEVVTDEVIKKMEMTGYGNTPIIPKLGCTNPVPGVCSSWDIANSAGFCRYSTCYIGPKGDPNTCLGCQKNCGTSCDEDPLTTYLDTQNEIINFGQACCNNYHGYSSDFTSYKLNQDDDRSHVGKADLDLSLMRDTIFDCRGTGTTGVTALPLPASNLVNFPCVTASSIYYMGLLVSYKDFYTTKQDQVIAHQDSLKCKIPCPYEFKNNDSWDQYPQFLDFGVNMNKTSGRFQIEYDMGGADDSPDGLELVYEERVIFSTNGFTTGKLTQDVTFSGESKIMRVIITSNGPPPNKWTVKISCVAKSCPLSANQKDAVNKYVVNMGSTSGWFSGYYDMKSSNPDSLKVKYEGQELFNTGGQVTGKGYFEEYFSGTNQIVTAIVSQSVADSAYSFTLNCPYPMYDCGKNFTNNSDDLEFNYFVDMKKTKGTAMVFFDMGAEVPDELQIFQDNKTIFETNGPVTGAKAFTLPFDGESTFFHLKLLSNAGFSTGNKWTVTIKCDAPPSCPLTKNQDNVIRNKKYFVNLKVMEGIFQTNYDMGSSKADAYTIYYEGKIVFTTGRRVFGVRYVDFTIKGTTNVAWIVYDTDNELFETFISCKANSCPFTVPAIDGSASYLVDVNEYTGRAVGTYDMGQTFSDQLIINYEGKQIYDSDNVTGSGDFREIYYGESRLIQMVIKSPDPSSRYQITLQCSGFDRNCPAEFEQPSDASFGTYYNYVVEMGRRSGTFTGSYDMYDAPDAMEVLYQGKLVYTTNGLVSGTKDFRIRYTGNSRRIVYRIMAGERRSQFEAAVECTTP